MLASFGRVPERCRYRVEGGAQARARVLNPVASSERIGRMSAEPQFSEVASELMEECSWTKVDSGRFRYQEILHILESRASIHAGLIASSWSQCRDRLVLFLVDSMVVC